MDSPARRRRESTCPLDCPDACSLTVEVEDGRVVRIDGDHRNPLTDGLICGKVRRLPEHLYCEQRLRIPMLRRGPKGAGSFEAVSWDEALDRVAEKLLAPRRAKRRQSAESWLSRPLEPP